MVWPFKKKSDADTEEERYTTAGDLKEREDTAPPHYSDVSRERYKPSYSVDDRPESYTDKAYEKPKREPSYSESYTDKAYKNARPRGSDRPAYTENKPKPEPEKSYAEQAYDRVRPKKYRPSYDSQSYEPNKEKYEPKYDYEDKEPTRPFGERAYEWGQKKTKRTIEKEAVNNPYSKKSREERKAYADQQETGELGKKYQILERRKQNLILKRDNREKEKEIKKRQFELEHPYTAKSIEITKGAGRAGAKHTKDAIMAFSDAAGKASKTSEKHAKKTGPKIRGEYLRMKENRLKEKRVPGVSYRSGGGYMEGPGLAQGISVQFAQERQRQFFGSFGSREEQNAPERNNIIGSRIEPLTPNAPPDYFGPVKNIEHFGKQKRQINLGSNGNNVQTDYGIGNKISKMDYGVGKKMAQKDFGIGKGLDIGIGNGKKQSFDFSKELGIGGNGNKKKQKFY